ncbi:hypothetical protein BD414DRAFT_539926 [Trametes punicea]|nr:hypothetical protein BD414DRAFT_539926 [Trametes punicea]
MAVPAYCEDCGANDPSSQRHGDRPPNQPPANLGVVLGVLGGCALVALVVVIVVPLVRRHVRRHGSIFSAPSRRSYRTVRDGDPEQEADADVNTRDLYLPSRRSSVPHQKMLSGPDAHPFLPLLLDPLRPMSALTWSDFRSRTKSPSASTDSLSVAMSDDGEPPGTDNAPSLSTNRATTSHRSTSTRSTRDRQPNWQNDLGRPVTGVDGPATRPALPSPHRSPTPPGLPSKREYSTGAARRASLPLPMTPTSPSDASQSRTTSGMPLFAPVPSASSTATVAGAALTRYPSGRPRLTTQKPGMEPVLEDAAADAYAETRSLQLPSPPASPEQPQPQWQGVTSVSAAIAPSTVTRRRPSLTATQSAPTAMSHRPRSSTGPAIPLTAAFQTSVLRSATQSTATTSTTRHRYPSIATSPPAAPGSPAGRTRPSSVSVTSGSGSASLLSPESPEMPPRPADTFRRMSTTDIHHRRQAHEEMAQGVPHSGRESQAVLRSTNAARTTQIQSGAAEHDSRIAAVSSGPSFTTPPPNPLSPPALAPTPPRMHHGYTHARASAPSTQQQESQRPALVKRKDSLALRPIPVSALLGSAPGTGIAGMSLGVTGDRSRSNSVRSTRTGAVQIPPLEPVTPLTLSLKSSSEEGEEQRR